MRSSPRRIALSRIIKPQSASSLRKKIMQTLAHSLNWAARSQGDQSDIKEVAAYIILGLRQISESVDQTATAWEKRDYWLKADRFRLDWIWADHSLRRLEAALQTEDWGELMAGFGELAGFISHMKVPKKLETTQPWDGAYQAWEEQTS
jgi:hypothetical protein